MKTSGLNPSTLKSLLIIVLICSLGAGTASFVYMQQFLKTYLVDVNHKQLDALASSAALSTLNTTKKELAENASVRKKISNLRAQSDFPEFLIVSEVKEIANENKIPVKTFSYQGAAGTTSNGQTTGPAALPGTVTQPIQQPATTQNSGQKTIVLLVDLDNPVNQKAFLQFIHDIEQHLPKMRLSGISVTPVDGSPDKINSGQLTIELYLS